MKSIGKYQVIEQLGSSAAGTTYRVRDSFRNREFALKVLHTVPGLTQSAKEGFCGHLGSCAELVHRHVIKIQDMGEVEEGLFVVSDWRTGVDLQRFMQDNRELPLGQKMALVAQVAEGLAFAHSRDIAHGDLKPSNVFVDANRDVTILDFGIARWLAALIEAGSRPQDLVVNYLAPEQVLGQPFDARSDIFALGLMLYEFVTGKYPFTAAAGLIPREIVHSEATPLRKLDPQIPEELDQLVQRALRKDPAERLQTAEEFASGLYIAAQELRRRASAASHAEAQPAAASAPLTPAPTAFFDAPAAPQVAAPPVAIVEAAQRLAEPPVRERPQDETGPPQPWTARSYSASTPLPPAPPAPGMRDTAFSYSQTPSQPAPAPVPAASQVSTPPAPVAPVPATAQGPIAPVPPAGPQGPFPVPPRRQPPPRPLPTVSANKNKKRAIVIVAGLVVAVGIISSLVSHQGLRASQNKRAAPAPAVHPTMPASTAIPPAVPAAPEPATAKSGQSGPDDIGNPEFSARQTLNGPVRTFWESGRYAEALALVNQVLANNPNNPEARAWKKKVREAQQAEAALK
jgi:serine/threonine-protein kinase